MFEDILSIVLRAAYWVLVPAALLRFYMQAVRAPFRNPLGQFVCAVTDWAVRPLRRMLAGKGGYDWASVVAAFGFELLHGALFDALSMRLSILRGGASSWLVSSLFGFAHTILVIAIACLIIYAILSWVRTDSVIGDILENIVNPWLRPIRRRVPMFGGIDLSPLVLLVLLQIALIVLGHAQRIALGALPNL